MASGLSLFEKKYPAVFVEFGDLIRSLNVEKRQEFFDNLAYFYRLQSLPTGADCNDIYLKLEALAVHKEHPFFKFLLFYLPIFFMPPCLEELEMVLSGQLKVDFQDRQKTIEDLKNGFWGHLLEFEAAANFAKYGCNVKILFKKNGGRCHDLECSIKNINVNFEISNRRYEINTQNLETIIKNKIVEEAEQLPPDGFNVIIIFLSDPLEDVQLNRQIDIRRRLHMFNFPEALYDKDSPPKEIKDEGNVRKVRLKSILETYPQLGHISAIIGWYHGQSPLRNSGFASRCLYLHSDRKLPDEFNQLIAQINEGSIIEFR